MKTNETKKGTAEEVLERMRRAYGAATSAELSGIAKIPKSTISNWLARGNIPFRYLYECSNRTGKDVDWLIYGEVANASFDGFELEKFKGGESIYGRLVENGGQEVLKRILAAYGFSMQKQLGELLGLSSGTMSTWVRRNYFPGDVIVACALDTGVDLRWLATGEGTMRRNSSDPTSAKKLTRLEIFTLIAGELRPNGLFNGDPRIVPDSIQDAACIESGRTVWLVDRGNKNFANGRWFIDMDGVIDFAEIARLPGNKLRVKSSSAEFECDANDIKPVGLVFTAIERFS